LQAKHQSSLGVVENEGDDCDDIIFGIGVVGTSFNSNYEK